MSVVNQTRRVFTRGTSAVFRTSFFDDPANTIPLIPLDVLLYPAYTIYDINNVAVQSGVAQPEATPGSYKVEFLVSPTAPLSHDLQRWRIEWQIVTVDTRQINFVEEFDVVDVVITATETREQKFITLAKQTYRSTLRLTSAPLEVGLDVYRAGDINQAIVTNAMYPMNIQRAVDGDSLVYYFDIPGNCLTGNLEYSVIWKTRYQVAEPYQFIFQILTAVAPIVLHGVTAVRMLVDKLQKRLGLAVAYEDSEIVEYLQRGNELVNSIYPSTFFAFGTLPNPFMVYQVLFASWYALQAQGLLQADLGFNFSGQTVTLDYDQSGAISDIGGRWLDFINSTLPALKMAVTRRNQPVGTVAGRAIRWSDTNAFTYKIASYSGNGSGIVSQMANLGLLF